LSVGKFSLAPKKTGCQSRNHEIYEPEESSPRKGAVEKHKLYASLLKNVNEVCDEQYVMRSDTTLS